MKQLTVNTQKPYEILMGIGLLDSTALYECTVDLAGRWVIVSDSNVSLRYGTNLKERMTTQSIQTDLITFPAGEQYKTRETKALIEDRMIALGCTRNIGIIALGGGVTCDLAGFVASTYCRGVPLIYIPTTMLAMVDAAIGGKTAVNSATAKNMIGTFYQPNAVFMDIATVQSLSDLDYRAGLVELIKHACLADEALFQQCEDCERDILHREPNLLLKLIYQNNLIKKQIVEEDEKETRIRTLLNYGHTIAHALESLSNYTLHHGIAVAKGIMFENHIAQRLGIQDRKTGKRIHALFAQYGITPTIDSAVSLEQLIKTAMHDKKNHGSDIAITTIEAIGKPHIAQGSYKLYIDNDAIADAFDHTNHLTVPC